MIKKRVFDGAEPTPILAREQAIMESIGSVMDVDDVGSRTLSHTFRPERIKNSVMTLRGDEKDLFVETQFNNKIKRVRKLDTQVMLMNNSS